MRLLVGLVAVVLGALIRLPKTDGQKSVRGQSDQGSANTQGDEAIRLLTAELVSIRADIRGAKTNNKKDQQERFLEWGTFVTLIIGAVAAVVTLIKLNETIELSRDQLKQSEALTLMAMDQAALFEDRSRRRDETSTTIAKEANLIARNASAEEIKRNREQTRARIATQAITVSIKGLVVHSDISFRNIGNTTARAMLQNGRTFIVPRATPFKPEFAPIGGNAQPGPLEPNPTGQPEQDSHMPREVNVTEEMLASFKKGEHVLYRFGLVAYTDIYDVRRIKQYCKVFGFVNQMTSPCYGDDIEREDSQPRQQQGQQDYQQ